MDTRQRVLTRFVPASASFIEDDIGNGLTSESQTMTFHPSEWFRSVSNSALIY
jgi:hypothetical protein